MEHGLQRVFCAHLKANIDGRRPERLAELAIASARSKARRRREDGIAYLIGLKLIGLKTEDITTLFLPANGEGIL